MTETLEISLRERIRQNLVSSMEKADINQVQLAEKLGISKGTVNNWTRGNNSPDVDMVPKICGVLGISILDLYSPSESERIIMQKSTLLTENKEQPTKYGELSKEAERVVKLFRRVPENQRALAADLVEAVLLALIRNTPVQTEIQSSVPAGSSR